MLVTLITELYSDITKKSNAIDGITNEYVYTYKIYVYDADCIFFIISCQNKNVI
jgi:hypothetical protein